MTHDGYQEMIMRIPNFDYRLLLIIPIILFLFSAGLLLDQYSRTGEWFHRSIEMKGGTIITINTEARMDLDAVESELRKTTADFKVRETRSFEGYSTLIEIGSDVESGDILSDLGSAGIDTSDNSVQQIGSSLGSSFWMQAQFGIIIAFIFMGIIVFIIFRSLVPSIAVILSAMFDILMTIAFMQVFGIELSLAGFAALLMLIGYSVDTDIMLTSRLLRESETREMNEKIRGALKTGLTMTLTTMGALVAMILSPISSVLTSIALVLFIGLVFDLANTWFMNSVLLRMYVERRGPE